MSQKQIAVNFDWLEKFCEPYGIALWVSASPQVLCAVETLAVVTHENSRYAGLNEGSQSHNSV
jgi:hypothetical protein